MYFKKFCMMAMLTGSLFVGETVQAAKKQPAAYSTQKDFGKKHEAVYVLLEQQEPSLAAAFLQATEWMNSRKRSTKAEKKEMGAFLSLLHKSSLRKDDKKTVRSFIHRATGTWSGGKIAGVAIGSFFAFCTVLGVAVIGELIQKATQAQNASFGFENDRKRKLFGAVGSESGASHSMGPNRAGRADTGSHELASPVPVHLGSQPSGGGVDSGDNNRRTGSRLFPLHMVPLTVAGRAGAATGSGGVSGSACPPVFFKYKDASVQLSPSTFAQGTALGAPGIQSFHLEYQQVINFLKSNAALGDSLEGVAVVTHGGTPKVLYSNGTQWFIDGASPQLHTVTDKLEVVCGLFDKNAIVEFITHYDDVQELIKHTYLPTSSDV